MGNEYEKLFSVLRGEPVPAALEARIGLALRAYQARLARLRVLGASVAGVLSGIGCVYGAQLFLEAARESGFFSYVALVASDGGSVLRNAKLFSLSVLESLPTLETALLLLGIAALVASLSAIATALPRYRRLSGALI